MRFAVGPGTDADLIVSVAAIDIRASHRANYVVTTASIYGGDAIWREDRIVAFGTSHDIAQCGQPYAGHAGCIGEIKLFDAIEGARVPGFEGDFVGRRCIQRVGDREDQVIAITPPGSSARPRAAVCPKP